MRISLCILGILLASSTHASDEIELTGKKGFAIESWNFDNVQVAVPKDQHAVAVHQEVQIHGKAAPDIADQHANYVVLHFLPDDGKLYAPSFNVFGERRQIDIYYYRWQLPALIALMQQFGTHGVECHIGETMIKDGRRVREGGTPVTVGDCDSTPKKKSEPMK